MKKQIVLEDDQLIEMVNESARRVLRRLMMENRYDLRGARVLAESENWMDDHTGGTEANNTAFKNWEATAREQGYSDAYINAIRQINDWVGGGAESNGLIDWSDGTPRVNEKAVAEFSDGDNNWFARNNSAERQEWYNALRAVIDREDQTRQASMALNNMVDLDAQIAQLEQDVAANPDNPGLQMNLEMLKQRRAMFQPTLQTYYNNLNNEANALMSGITNGTVANTPENQAMLGNMQQTLFMLNQNAYPYLNIPQASTTQDQTTQDQTQNQTPGQNQTTNNLGMNNNWGWGMNFGNGNQAGYNWLNYNQHLMPGVVTTDANGNQVTTDVNGNQVTLTSPNAQTTNTTGTQGASQTNNTRTTSNAGSARPAATNTARTTNNARTARPAATNTARATNNARATRPVATNNTRVAPSSTVSTATSTPTVNTATQQPAAPAQPATPVQPQTPQAPTNRVMNPQGGAGQPQPQVQPQPQRQPQAPSQQGQPTVATHGAGGQQGQPNQQQVPGRTIQAGIVNTAPNRYVAGYNPNFRPNNMQVRPTQIPQNPYQQQRR